MTALSNSPTFDQEGISLEEFKENNCFETNYVNLTFSRSCSVDHESVTRPNIFQAKLELKNRKDFSTDQCKMENSNESSKFKVLVKKESPANKKRKEKPYAEGYRRMLMAETELERTTRLAKQREYGREYRKRKALAEYRRRRNPCNGTEAKPLELSKPGEKRRKSKPKESTEQDQKRRKNKSQIAQSANEEIQEYSKQVEDDVEQQYRQPRYDQQEEEVDSKTVSDQSISVEDCPSSGDESAISIKIVKASNVAPAGRTAVEIFKERGMRRLVVLVERIDVDKAIQEIKAQTRPQVAAN